MIVFKDNCNSEPYKKFCKYYMQAIEDGQPNADAICISSYSKNQNLVDSRFVNLKFVDGQDFIFFSNYSSPKALQFNSHDLISVSIFWHKINLQIRMKAYIRKTNKDFNKLYFKDRSPEKNALAISSMQSNQINSFQEVKEKYYDALKHSDLDNCPEYWGGYAFRPYIFEFWEGHKNRLNKRTSFALNSEVWKKTILEP